MQLPVFEPLYAGDVTYFPCNAWLRMAPAGSSEGSLLGSAAQPMELLGSSQDPRQQLREYKVGAAASAAAAAGMRLQRWQRSYGTWHYTGVGGL
jgi:hypothetical protein